MGARFWFGLVGGVLAAGLLVAIIFRILGQAILHWGFFGALIVIAVIAIAFGWLYDRRQPARYQSD
jgi:Na+/melibiose symporter-like transporter